MHVSITTCDKVEVTPERDTALRATTTDVSAMYLNVVVSRNGHVHRVRHVGHC